MPPEFIFRIRKRGFMHDSNKLRRFKMSKSKTLNVKVPVPSSAEDSLNAEAQTISSCPNKGETQTGAEAPLVDAGVDSGVGFWLGDGTDISFESEEK
jgi:hypothetical protein